MNAHSTIQPVRTNSNARFRVHAVLSMLTAALGVALLIYMVTVEDEPGALPLGLIVVGIAWFIIARAKLKSPPVKA